MKRRIAKVSAMDGNVVSDVKRIVGLLAVYTLFILLSSMTIIGKIYGEGVSSRIFVHTFGISTLNSGADSKHQEVHSTCTTYNRHACLNQVKHCNSQSKDWPAGPAIGEAWGN